MFPRSRPRRCFILCIFRCHCCRSSLTLPSKFPKPLFQTRPSRELSKGILFQTGTPCQGGPKLLLDFPRAATEETSKPVQPPSNMCRDEISRSGEPLTPMSFSVFCPLLGPGGRLEARAVLSHTNLTRRIDPRGPEGLDGPKTRTCLVC